MAFYNFDLARANPVVVKTDSSSVTSRYPENSVGRVMTDSFVALEPNQTVSEALETIRLHAPIKDTIYFAYVLDEMGHILGVISLRDLILADPEKKLRKIMAANVVFCHALDEQSISAQLIGQYDLLAIPVVNEAYQMVGVVTHEAGFDVATKNNTEDQLKLGGVGKLVGSIKNASISTLYKMRVGWLVALVFGNIFSGAGIAHFEGLIEQIVALVFFLPLLVDSGGNAGSQSATLVVRGLATGDVTARDWFKLLRKELLVALLLGLSMAVAVSTIGFFRSGPEIALVVSLTMVGIVTIGSLIGIVLPFALNKLKMDPAAASAPLITSLCDGVGVLVYFNIANALLEIPTT